MGIRRREPILKEIRSYKISIEGKSNELISPSIEFVGRLTPNRLVEILFDLNKRKGSDMPRSFNSYLKEAKILLGKYEPDQIIEIIKISSDQCYYGFGFDYVKRILDEQTNTPY